MRCLRAPTVWLPVISSAMLLPVNVLTKMDRVAGTAAGDDDNDDEDDSDSNEDCVGDSY